MGAAGGLGGEILARLLFSLHRCPSQPCYPRRYPDESIEAMEPQSSSTIGNHVSCLQYYTIDWPVHEESEDIRNRSDILRSQLACNSRSIRDRKVSFCVITITFCSVINCHSPAIRGVIWGVV